MAERSTIVDKHGDAYSIALFEDDEFFAMRVYHSEIQIGFARCLVEGGLVELSDIRTDGWLERTNFINLLLRSLRRFRGRNYQSRGIGSKLLKEIVSYSREIGALSLYGNLTGEKDLLACWYSRHDFDVDTATGKITLRLNA